MTYHFYILYSKSLNKYYVGHTNNLTRRLSEHNSGQTKSTRSGKPWILVYTDEFNSKLEANKEEIKIKKMKSRKYIESLINSG
jgi:putative endonuclease